VNKDVYKFAEEWTREADEYTLCLKNIPDETLSIVTWRRTIQF